MAGHNISIWAAMSSCINSEVLLDISDQGNGAGRSGRAIAAIGHRLFLQLLFMRYAEIAGHERDGQLHEVSEGPYARERVGNLYDAISSEYSFSPFDSRDDFEHELGATEERELCRCIKRLYLLNLGDGARPDHISLAHLAWAFGLVMKALDEERRPPARGNAFPAAEIAHLASSLVELYLSGKPSGSAANLRVFDPFCGAGYLLLVMFDEFLSRQAPGGTAPDPATIVGARLWGMDCRAWAADATRTFLAIRYLLALGPCARFRRVPPMRATVRDKWSLDSRTMAGVDDAASIRKGTFDLAICDITLLPARFGPWLDPGKGQEGLICLCPEGWKRNGYRCTLIGSLPSLLAPAGMAGAIVSTDIIMNEHDFMRHLCKRGVLHRVVDFRRDIFRHRAGQATSFIYMDEARLGPLEAFRYPSPPPGAAAGFLAPWAGGFVLPGSLRTSDRGFLSLAADEARILDKLERTAQLCLGDFSYLVAGRSTGRDDVFILEPAGVAAAMAGLTRIHSRAANADFDLEPQALLPIAEADGIKRYASQLPRRLILPFSTGTDGTAGIVPADSFAGLPRSAAYLAGLSAPHPARSQAAKPSFRYRPPRRPPCADRGQTFIVGRDSAEEGFAILSGPAAIGDSLIAALPRDAGSDMYYLLGILNSSLFRWYVSILRPTPTAHSRPALRDLGFFPLVPPDPANPRASAIRPLVLQRLALAGTGTAALSAAAQSVEQKIDEAVFRLYGLTRQESDMVMSDLVIDDAYRQGKGAGIHASHSTRTAVPHVTFDYDKPYGGMLPGPYDPFDASTSRASPGSPHFVGPSEGPSFRFCRWAGLDSLAKGTTAFGLASGPARAASLAAAHPKVFTARCRLDVAAGQRFLIPSADPNSLRVSVKTPDLAGARYTIEHDPADNWYLTFDRDYNGVLEYGMELDGPLTENAFIEDFGRFSDELPILPRTGPIEELHFDCLPAVGDFILRMQAYFSTYDPQNGRPELIAALEAETTAQARMAFMIAKRAGSCRHRAWLGYLLCTEAGLPTRYDLSAVHAWLECQIEGKWRYIDLGGTPMEFNPPSDGCSTEPRIEPPCRSCDPGCIEYPYCPRRAWGRPCKQYCPRGGH